MAIYGKHVDQKWQKIWEEQGAYKFNLKVLVDKKDYFKNLFL